MNYEQLLVEYEDDVEVIEQKMHLKGFYLDGHIFIKNNLTSSEKNSIMAEELGHHFTSRGNIVNLKINDNARQERAARDWAIKRLLSFEKLISAFEDRVRSKHDLAEYLNVSEEFLLEALEFLKRKYGMIKRYKDYIIYFEPFGIYKSLDKEDDVENA